MTVNCPARNPLADTALTKDDVRDGGRFLCYVPGKPETEKRGMFMGYPFSCTGGPHEGHVVVWVQWRGDIAGTPERTSELGITPSPYTGQYGERVCIPESEQHTSHP